MNDAMEASGGRNAGAMLMATLPMLHTSSINLHRQRPAVASRHAHTRSRRQRLTYFVEFTIAVPPRMTRGLPATALNADTLAASSYVAPPTMNTTTVASRVDVAGISGPWYGKTVLFSLPFISACTKTRTAPLARPHNHHTLLAVQRIRHLERCEHVRLVLGVHILHVFQTLLQPATDTRATARGSSLGESAGSTAAKEGPVTTLTLEEMRPSREFLP
jgi:hypothetical protein